MLVDLSKLWGFNTGKFSGLTIRNLTINDRFHKKRSRDMRRGEKFLISEIKVGGVAS